MTDTADIPRQYYETPNLPAMNRSAEIIGPAENGKYALQVTWRGIGGHKVATTKPRFATMQAAASAAINWVLHGYPPRDVKSTFR